MEVRIRPDGTKDFYTHGKMVGNYNSLLNTFSKRVVKAKHFFRVISSWGIDSEIFSFLLAKNAKIKIHDIEDDVLYEISASDFDKAKQYFHFRADKKDYSKQVFCRSDNFEVSRI
jgi:hypothetical protein